MLMRKSIGRLLLPFLLISLLFLGACNFESGRPAAKAPTQEEMFMTALLEGLNARNADDRDDTNMTIEENAAYYKTLVCYELDRISSYDTVTFSDATFNQLAHDYINGCKRQLAATSNVSDEAAFYSEWGAGLVDRAKAAIALHDSYGLQLSQEILGYFQEATSYTLESFAAEATEAIKATPEEGVDAIIEVGKDGSLIYRIWLDGFSADAYWASQGDEESVTAYSNELKELIDGFADIQASINQQLQAVGLPETNIEIHLMNDVNRDNTISIIKKGRVVYDSALGIDMLGVGENLQ